MTTMDPEQQVIEQKSDEKRDYEWPYAAIGLTVVYVVYAIIVQVTTPQCVHEPCNSEGLNNDTSGYATDFFIGLAMIFMGIHLLLLNKTRQVKVLMSGINALFGMSMGFIVGGFIHWFLPNNAGNGDGKLMPGYYIANAVAYIFLGWSTLEHYRFTQHVCGRTTVALKLILALIILCTILVIFGCIWCVAQPDLHTSNIIDEYEPNLEESNPICTDIFLISEFAWFAFYGIFWFIASIWLYRMAKQQPKSVWGLPNTWAAIGTGTVQLTIGFMWFIWIGVLSIVLAFDPGQAYSAIYGPIIFHYGILIAMFFTHNLALTLQPVANVAGKEVKGEEDSGLDEFVENPRI